MSIPLLQLGQDSSPSSLRIDITAGISVCVIMIPSVIAYAELAGLPPAHGLYAALTAMVAYALFASSRQVVAGPDAAITVLVASAVGPLAGADPGRAAALAAVVALMGGGLMLLAAGLKAGVVADFLSKPVLRGISYRRGPHLDIHAVGQAIRDQDGGARLFPDHRGNRSPNSGNPPNHPRFGCGVDRDPGAVAAVCPTSARRADYCRHYTGCFTDLWARGPGRASSRPYAPRTAQVPSPHRFSPRCSRVGSRALLTFPEGILLAPSICRQERIRGPGQPGAGLACDRERRGRAVSGLLGRREPIADGGQRRGRREVASRQPRSSRRLGLIPALSDASTG